MEEPITHIARAELRRIFAENCFTFAHGTLFMHFATREELTQPVVEKFGERLNLELPPQVRSILYAMNASLSYRSSAQHNR